MADETLEVVEIVPRDCGYGWSAQALLSDGSIRYGTTSLFPTKESAIEAVRRATTGAAR